MSSSLGLASGTVRIVPYDPEWPRLFEAAAIRLRGGRRREGAVHPARFDAPFTCSRGFIVNNRHLAHVGLGLLGVGRCPARSPNSFRLSPSPASRSRASAPRSFPLDYCWGSA